MNPSLEDIKAVLTEYEGKELDDFADWYYENWYAELPHLRHLIFNQLTNRLYLYYNSKTK